MTYTSLLIDGHEFAVQDVRVGASPSRPSGPPDSRGPIPSGPRATTSLAVGKQQR